MAAVEPPKYSRSTGASKLDPFKEWICEQLAADPRIQSQRLREMAGEIGYHGGKSIFDDFVREVRPRFPAARTFQRTIYRPRELVQRDLWEPSEHIPVGHGQRRRGWVVTCEVCWSRPLAGTLVFSEEAPDILWGSRATSLGWVRCRRSWCGTGRRRSPPAAARLRRSRRSAGSCRAAG